jgi:hypothetical protein
MQELRDATATIVDSTSLADVLERIARTAATKVHTKKRVQKIFSSNPLINRTTE